MSELYSPVSGEVVEVNAALKSKPEAVNTDPHGSWLIVVRLSKPNEVAGLLDAAQYGEPREMSPTGSSRPPYRP